MDVIDQPSKSECPTEAADGSGPGCAILLGVIVIACATGTLYGSVYSWLVFGGGVLALGVVAAFLSIWLTVRSQGRDQ